MARGNLSLSRGPRGPLIPTLRSLPFTGFQKRAMDLRARALDRMPSYVSPDLSFYNPPTDNSPFTVTPQPAPFYPPIGAGPITVISFTVPVGLLAVIREMAIVHVGGNAPDFTGIVIWRVTKNGGGVRGLNALNAQYGTFAAPKSLVLYGVENDVFTVTVELPATLPDGTANPGMPAGSKTAASFDGWTYQLAKAIQTSGS